MDGAGLDSAVDRAERAIARIERALRSASDRNNTNDEPLRARVREAVAELDRLIGDHG